MRIWVWDNQRILKQIIRYCQEDTTVGQSQCLRGMKHP